MRAWHRTWAWLALAALPACAASGADSVARDVARLEGEVRRLRTEREADRARLQELEARVQRMSRPASRGPSIPPGLAVVRVGPGSAFDEEEGSAFVADVSDTPVRRSPPPARPAPGRSAGGVDAAPPLPTDVEIREPPILTGPPPDYRAAEEALRRGEVERAAVLFEIFVAGAPGDAYADNALVARGDALVRLGDPAAALEAYERAANGYPAGDAVPEALLRYGETSLALGRSAAARAAFERLVADHPGTELAATARGRLAEL